ncbi:MAG: hypothetical protein INR62_09100 [Rhodospirillales bacterium]|nr:hypothetical protein [Acetobacter sp.]
MRIPHFLSRFLRWMLAWVCVVSLPLPVVCAAPEDAFLDAPLPKDLPVQMQSSPSAKGDGSFEEHPMLPLGSFWNGVQLLGKLSGKPVRLPAELAEWPDERTESVPGWSYGLPSDGKVRELFARLCFGLGLTWRYDAKTDAINLRPEWWRDDPRTGKDLLGILLAARPVRLESMVHDPEPNDVGGHSLLLDPWRLAFDALLSRPENFAEAGALRLCHDNHGLGSMLGITENLCAARFSGADGRPGMLVLNGQQAMSNKENPGDVAYYLFDEEGKFLRGGVYAIAPGHIGAIINARVEEDRILAVTVCWGSFARNPTVLRFALADGDLVLQGSTDNQGVERDAAGTQNLPDHSPGPIVRQEYRFPVH